LAGAVILEDDVTVAERVTLLTHMNVGYADHPLRTYFPPTAACVIIRSGAFIGACATLLSGVEIGACSVVGAGALVRSNVPPFSIAGGVPARILRVLEKGTERK
jgi:acetyltransferase-like isoleucine patch superfamily enzyme